MSAGEWVYSAERWRVDAIRAQASGRRDEANQCEQMASRCLWNLRHGHERDDGSVEWWVIFGTLSRAGERTWEDEHHRRAVKAGTDQ